VGRGKRWTEQESQKLLEMLEAGMTVGQICQSVRLPGRSFCAILKQAQRLGADLSRQRKIRLSGQIREAEILPLEALVSRFVDAFNKLCDLTEASKEDLERYRIVFSAARTYFDLYLRLEEFSEVKSRVERLEAMVAQLAT